MTEVTNVTKLGMGKKIKLDNMVFPELNYLFHTFATTITSPVHSKLCVELSAASQRSIKVNYHLRY